MPDPQASVWGGGGEQGQVGQALSPCGRRPERPAVPQQRLVAQPGRV